MKMANHVQKHIGKRMNTTRQRDRLDWSGLGKEKLRAAETGSNEDWQCLFNRRMTCQRRKTTRHPRSSSRTCAGCCRTQRTRGRARRLTTRRRTEEHRSCSRTKTTTERTRCWSMGRKSRTETARSPVACAGMIVHRSSQWIVAVVSRSSATASWLGREAAVIERTAAIESGRNAATS